jgi:nucleotide-binding universal stress UspA family protein
MSSPALSTILVHVDGAPGAARRIAVAGALADAFGARLAGCAAGQFVVPVYAPFGEGFVALQPEILEAAHTQIKAQIKAAEAAFRAAAGLRTDLVWHGSDVTEPVAYLVRHARAADLVVIGRNAKDEPEDTALGVASSDVVMTAGRPVLVVPPGVTHLSAKRIVVAWKDTRESRLAAIAALPLLKAAEEVFVTGAGEDIALADVQDVASWLARYGIVAKPLIEEVTDGRPATALLRVASRVHADIVVAGAFGHSRMREWVFGGVTRDLLDHATVPVLFAH